jgi:hypothetical protein
MRQQKIIEVPIPEGVDPVGDDLEILKATFQALAALRLAQGRDWMKRVRELEKDGWTVRWGLTWRAEAKRGEAYEDATGVTLDEALSDLAQLIMAETSGHVP